MLMLTVKEGMNKNVLLITSDFKLFPTYMHNYKLFGILATLFVLLTESWTFTLFVTSLGAK
jgi:hypothetical protein